MPLTLVILHGWGQSSSDWAYLCHAFENDFRVVIFDLPGFGNEPRLKENATIPDYAQWVISKLSTFEGKKVILGHSFGGRIASYIASSKPSWLQGLILYGSPSLYRPRLKVTIKIRLAKILKACHLKKFMFMKNTELLQADTNNLGMVFRNAVSFDQTKRLPSISVPTLILVGENDFVVPLRITSEMHRLIPHSTLSVMDTVGHNAHKENSTLFYGIIKNFLKTL